MLLCQSRRPGRRFSHSRLPVDTPFSGHNNIGAANFLLKAGFPKDNRYPRLQPGMTLAVEPMVNLGTWEVRVMKDGWTVKTADGALSAHFENSILITDGEPEILTVCEEASPWI